MRRLPPREPPGLAKAPVPSPPQPAKAKQLVVPQPAAPAYRGRKTSDLPDWWMGVVVRACRRGPMGSLFYRCLEHDKDVGIDGLCSAGRPAVDSREWRAVWIVGPKREVRQVEAFFRAADGEAAVDRWLFRSGAHLVAVTAEHVYATRELAEAALGPEKPTKEAKVLPFKKRRGKR